MKKPIFDALFEVLERDDVSGERGSGRSVDPLERGVKCQITRTGAVRFGEFDTDLRARCRTIIQ